MPEDKSFLDGLARRQLDSSVDVSQFTCNETIDWYLSTVALDHHNRRVTSVWCWIAGHDLAGFVTTSMHLATLEESRDRERFKLSEIILRRGAKHYKRVPALLIGMLGVCDRYKRRGLGEHMVKFAVGQAVDLSHTVGCRLVSVDSDDSEAAIGLYTKLGFVEINRRQTTVQMYYDLGPLT